MKSVFQWQAMSLADRWRFDPLGEAALLATCAETDMDAANRAALALADAIIRAGLPGVSWCGGSGPTAGACWRTCRHAKVGA